MRTNYPLDKIVRRKDDERRRLMVALVVIGVVVFLLVFNNSVRAGLNKIVISVTRPLWVMENNTLVLGGDLFKFFRSHKGLVEENRQLKEEIFRLNSEVLTKNLIQTEYDRLLALTGQIPPSAKPVLGRVVLKPNRTPYDLVVVEVVEVGGRQIKIGDVARLTSDVTLGKVVGVSGRTATIELFSSPGLATAVLVGENRLQATTTGRGAGNMILELPRGLDIASGDKVLLPTGGVQLVGMVGEVISDQTEPAQKLLVSLPINLFNLSWVYIYEH